MDLFNTPPKEQLLFEDPIAVVPSDKDDWRNKIPTVSQLTRNIRGTLESAFLDTWVKGEISNFKKPVSGHAYFCLKDATAQIKAVIFKGQLSKHKFDIKDGMEVLIHGTITVYEARGDYQILADTIEPVGVGALQLAFNQLKEKLFKEGLFSPEHKKRLPFLPRRIGIITSATGAAIKDILKVISRRYPDRELYLLPASVQGEKATLEICQALERAEIWNQKNPEKALEVLIVGRGGGSLEDLWCFNEEAVARAIYNCNIPIISAVGHEIDTTISDFVADIRAATPSQAAEIVLPEKRELILKVENTRLRLEMLLQRRLEQLKLHLTHLSRRLQDPREKIKKLKENFIRFQEKMVVSFSNRILLRRRRLEALVQLLDSFSPLKVLGRGYALTRTADGKILKSIANIQAGEEIQTQLSDGKLVSKVVLIER